MKPDYAALAAELAAPAYAALTDSQAAAALNAPGSTPVYAPVPIVAAVDQLIALGRLTGIQQAAEAAVQSPGTATPAQLAALQAVALLQTLRRYGAETVSLAPGHHHRAVMDALVDGSAAPDALGAGIITQDDRDALVALGTSYPSWADAHWTGQVTAPDVAHARTL